MYKILIVDDEPMVKVALKTIICWEDYGFSICASASDGKEALSLIDRYVPDIIITDLKMPVMDGLELIEALKKQKYPGKILVLSNYGDYEYVRHALKSGAADYMLKISLNKEELLHQLQCCTELLKTQKTVIQNTHWDSSLNELFLKNYFTDKDFPYEKLQNCSLPEADAYYLCYITQPFGKNFTNKNHGKIPSDSVKNLLLENFGYIPSENFIQLYANSFLILYSEQTAAEIDLTVYGLGERIRDYFSQFLSLSLYVIVTETASTMENLKEIYYNCTEVSMSCFYDVTSPVYIEQLHLQHFINYLDYRTFSTELLSLLSKNSVQQKCDSFDLFMEKCEAEKIHPELLKNYLYKMCSYMELTLSHSDCVDLIKLQSSLDDCTNLKQLHHILLEFFADIQNILKADTLFYKKEVVECISYIRNHCHERITLTELSASIGISENYLCKIFKDDVGMSIVQYMNNLRMEKAAAMISENNLYLREIAETVGISDQFYFNRLFKKTYGMTPTQYKEKQKKSHFP